MAAKSRSVVRPARRSGVPWGQGLICGVVAAVATPTAALAGGLLAPALLMFMLDPGEGRPASRCMLLSGLAVAAFPLTALWTGGHSMDLALSLLADPTNLVGSWIAQAGGWLLAELMPLLIGAAQATHSASRTYGLKTARARLEEEWGIAPADPASAA